MVNDHAQQDRRRLIDAAANAPEPDEQARLFSELELRSLDAKAKLGQRYVLHPANRVQRLPRPLADRLDGSTILNRQVRA